MSNFGYLTSAVYPKGIDAPDRGIELSIDRILNRSVQVQVDVIHHPDAQKIYKPNQVENEGRMIREDLKFCKDTKHKAK